jgi:hypothetical protein
VVKGVKCDQAQQAEVVAEFSEYSSQNPEFGSNNSTNNRLPSESDRTYNRLQLTEPYSKTACHRVSWRGGAAWLTPYGKHARSGEKQEQWRRPA